MQLIQPYSLLVGSVADWIAGASALLLAILALGYWRRRAGRDPGCYDPLRRRPGGEPRRGGAGRDPGRYDPQLAWLRAGLYFCAALLLSWSLGVLHGLLAAPLVAPEQWRNPYWAAYTLAYALFLWFAYMVLWPRGTFTDGRKRHPLIATGYGLAWGLCHGQVFLCFWALAERTGLGSFWVAALSWLLLSGYNFAYHQFFWDVHVSPPHNHAAWNAKKVLFCHAPNLLLGLAWLAIWGNFGLWLLFQAGCLLASAHHMRFPAWHDDYSAVAGETR